MEEEEAMLFWDEFAQEYAQIQQESSLQIAKEVVAYLLDQQVFPISIFVDFAAGAGRYISAFYPYVDEYYAIDFSKEMLKIIEETIDDPQNKLHLIQQSQSDFLTTDQHWPCIFMAMNPAVRDKEALLQFQKKAHQLIILRMIAEEENVFQPFEEDPVAEKELQLNTYYKKWLSEEAIEWRSCQFEYMVKEEIDRDLFHLYFEEEYSSEQRQQMVQHVFGEALTVESQTKITFELLLSR
ncbi:methyltransferase domain-containing protein [Enterococcus casseliflavus]|uniref:methyltransferase domain-containing protein n=1 Tax=Enterococcus casseliflavus TaxID=37734 RepID=UPI00191AC1E7|nr:class I SAM-dependent methyltransferase [Enterococcus casseliflavus]QQU16101.1 methyltransferase domain-containing protein [Enterococcus casseliflavus]